MSYDFKHPLSLQHILTFVYFTSLNYCSNMRHCGISLVSTFSQKQYCLIVIRFSAIMYALYFS